METTIRTWGNSEAVRIPRAILRLAKLGGGDRVAVDVNERGNIEISPIGQRHRRVAPKRGVSFSSLFKGYEPPPNATATAGNAWPNDDLVGAEWDAWTR